MARRPDGVGPKSRVVGPPVWTIQTSFPLIVDVEHSIYCLIISGYVCETAESDSGLGNLHEVLAQ